jgi:hypothetical protein
MKKSRRRVKKVSLPPAVVTRAKPARAKPGHLLGEVRKMILAARERVARAVDSGLTLLYWHIGRRIRQDILQEERAEYGSEIISALSKELCAEFGNGFSGPNLSRMMRFAEVFPDQRIISTLSKELGWSHFVEIIPFDEPLQRDFYAEMCRIEQWSVRTLRQKIDGMLFERTALSKKPEKLAAKRMQIDGKDYHLTCCSTTARCADWWLWT